MVYNYRKTLAWHETLEIHELVAFQSTGLIKLKMGFRKITDKDLKVIYQRAIKDLEKNINELLQFYPSAPSIQRVTESKSDHIAFYAGDLLGIFKSSIRNYANAITETATPELRKVFLNQLIRAINLHERIFTYMYQKGYYPSYDFGQILHNDQNLAQKALSMKY
ncbi:spore coat protein [Bacillus sp. S/N-304-OC-R1]|uniref:spore coat protein n=1 Tax=Bacillus sp. S/N-304-OC-R1 TaxID=2758034 RepID=UPI001C8E8997|nr:spore coat protein [Bacillus sp. S/N-304-OC-R1]MBY0121328.1 spore coat protein [Bacillus sp. S/N-304-OC-R1]